MRVKAPRRSPRSARRNIRATESWWFQIFVWSRRVNQVVMITTKIAKDTKVSDYQSSELRDLRTTIVQSFRGSRKFSKTTIISRSRREFTAETPSTPRKEVYQSKLQT